MMMHKVTHLAGAALLAAQLTTGTASAQATDATLLLAQDNCFAVGQSAAAQRGARLVAAEAATRNGQAVCKITLLVPATNGERPKREIIFVPR